MKKRIGQSLMFIIGGFSFMVFSSNLKRVLSSDDFALTCEVGPPKGCDSNQFKSKAEIVSGCVDAYNVTDNQTAVTRLSSLAGCCFLLDMELEPVIQLGCRDRNRIGLQSDILGAYALGVRNFLLVTGDHQCFGNHPGARGVFDLDSIQLINVVKNMRDEGIFASGDAIKSGKPSDIFIGGAANPFADPFEFRVDRLELKVERGVDFIQTQSVFNVDKFKEWMSEVCSRGLDKRVHILAGVTPLKSVRMAERMKYHVPGVDIPDYIYDRIVNASDVKSEGFDIASELINEIKKIQGVHGLHVTALFWEDVIPGLLKECNLLPRS